jgi:zinc transport system ATP-binding protein
MPQYTQLDPDFPITVMDIVIMGYLNKRLYGSYSKPERRSAAAVLDEVGLIHLSNRSFSELSGGQRQRVLIARAIVSRPEILLLDEPTANIDAGVLQKLNERMTILVATHDLGFVSKLVKSVICVNRTVAVHPTGEICGKVIQELYHHGQRLVRHDKFLY